MAIEPQVFICYGRPDKDGAYVKTNPEFAAAKPLLLPKWGVSVFEPLKTV